MKLSIVPGGQGEMQTMHKADRENQTVLEVIGQIEYGFLTPPSPQGKK